ncbi:E3 ubiquitin-protein ligase rnf213-alpha-like isoform X1 [Thunnus thynnus]|uniref:E3 ubiquitin-protein ligase rnf213-alpha-like isoform X1 n=2 Tax=Thunnus thynnus TaxID=8237 RepID=UPI003527624F
MNLLKMLNKYTKMFSHIHNIIFFRYIMFCPECGIQVEKSYKFCPECGFKLFALTQNRTQDVATPTHQQSVTTEERNQKEKPVQVPKDVKEEQENTAQFKGQPASDDSEPARAGSTRQDLSDNTSSSATPEIKTTPSSPYQTPSDGKSVTTRRLVTESCKEEERLSGTAHALDSNAQPCRETACLNNLSVPTSPPSPTPACDEVTEQQTEIPSDISTENSPNAVRIHDDKPSDNHPGPLSNSASSLTSIQETNTSAPALSEQTPQESDLVAKQSASEQDKEKRLSHEIQNLSESTEDHINPEEHTFTEQTQRKEGQADEPNTKQIKSSVDPCSVTQETAKNIEGQLASDNLGSAMGHVSPQDTTAIMETRTSPSFLHQKLSDRELDSNSQPEQQTETPSDIITENSPNAVPIHDDKPSDNHPGPLSNSASSLTSTQETNSTAPALSEQTPQESDLVAKQSASEQDKEKRLSHEIQNLSESPEDHINPEEHTFTEQTQRKEGQADEPNTKQIKSSVDPCSVTQETAKNIEGQLASDNLESAMGHVSPQDTTATMETRTSPSFLHQKLSNRELDSQPEQQIEAPSDINPGNSPDVVTVPADKQSDIHSRKLSNSVSSQRSTKETISTAPEVPEQTPEKQTSPEIKTISHETQNLSERPDESSNESHTNMEIQSITKQTDRKEDQAAGKKAADTKSDGKTNTHLTKKQEQQPGNSNVDVSRSLTPSSPPSQSDAEGGQLVAADILKKAIQPQTPQISSISECIPVYFHVVTSKDFHLDPEKDLVILKSEKLFGNWDAGKEMTFSKSLGDKRYLVEQRHLIPKNIIHESIPYKYAVLKNRGKNYEVMYETIYQKEGNHLINRCLSIKRDLLTHKGEWHQYDDVIHSDVKKNFWTFLKSTQEAVMKGRDQAGREMLKIIFDLLTTWNEQNVGDFFFLLRQFIEAYSYPLLHDGVERSWGLPYGPEQVKILLKSFLEENIYPKSRKGREKTESLLPPLHAGVIGLLVYNKYLREHMTDQPISNLCDLLCLPNKPQHHFRSFWKDFASPLPDKKSVADAVEILCSSASQRRIEKWVLVIPLIHLLRGESKPFEPVPPVLNPEFDSWSGLRGSKGTNMYRDTRSLIGIMKDHAYLVDIDHFLAHSWMSLLSLDDLMSFMSRVPVELLDILLHLHFSVRSGITHSDYRTLKELASHLIKKESHRNNSFDDKYGECCLKTAVRLLGSICRKTTDPDRCDIPLIFLELVCLIAKSYDYTDSQSRERIHEESIGETLETMREWRRTTFKNKLLNEWNRTQFSVPHEIEVWNKLLSLSFSHEQHTSFWRTTFTEDFEGKLKQEHPVNQIGIYSNKMEELSKTSPVLCRSMEKCALEAIAAICQDKSGRNVSALLERHDITKFGKLMSVVVLKSWPTDAKGDYIEGEDLIFEYLLNWPMAKTVFQMAGAREGLIDKLSDEAQIRMTLASSAFKSVSEKFLSGEIQMKTLDQILQREREFVDLLKIDGLCDDGRCKDDRNMRRLLRLRNEEAEAVSNEKELVRSLLQICQELPQHVKVDFMGLDIKLHQKTETMNLNEFMKVLTLDRQCPPTVGQVTYFNLCDITRQMASELHAIKDSSIFKVCWMNRVEELSRDQPDTDDTEHLDGNEEIYTLDLVYSKIFQSCYSKYKGLYDGLKSGELLLEEIDSLFEDYKGNYEDLRKDLQIMCRTNPSDNRRWITERINQIQQYQDLHLAMDTAKIIMDIRNTICPEGDFKVLEKLLQMNQADFKKNSLNCIDDTFINAKHILKDITDNRRECLQQLSLTSEFVQWVKKALEDINELKVFVDLASISAGENDLDVDRVACFHDAVLGYSSILYGLKEDSDFKAFNESLSKLWKALENDRNIPKKLRDTARHLEWLKTVKESHGSVEFSSLSLATSINERGIYIIKAQNQKKLILETSLMLQIQDGPEENMTCTYDDLKELQNKLMLMSGRGEQNQSEVECFAEVFDNVQRLAKVFVDLYAAGNPLFRFWEAKIYCKTRSGPCIIMEINFCKTVHHIEVCGSLVEQLTALSKKMELFLDDWQNFMNKQRSDHYYLNFFTAEQISYLCSVVTPTNENAVIEDKALMMLSFIKPNCTTSDVWSTWRRFHNQFEPGKRVNEDIPFQSHFLHQDDMTMSSANMSQVTTDDPAEKAEQTVGLKELEELWNAYMKNEGIFFHDLLDIRSLGGLLKMMTDTEYQNEDEWEETILSETKDNSLRRTLPKGLVSNQPNLIICPQDEVLTSSICLYMTNDYEPLPSYDEVLLCTPATSYEQVELFLRRCLTPGDFGQKIYTMLRADQLSYEVSCAMEKCFQKLRSLFKHEYSLVIYCSSDREHTYIPTVFSQFKRDFVPKESLERIQKYLSQHYTVPSDHKNAVFKGGHSVGIVASRRAGVGKSLYVQRLYEKLEENVEQGTAFKKCIRLTEHEVNDHKVLQSLYDSPKQKDLKMFHFDVTSSVQKGLNEFLFKLLFLRYLMDSDGWMWRCSHKHLYIIELLESTNDQPRYAPRSGRKENFAFLEVFPKVICRPPKEVMALEMRREEITDMESDDPLMDDKCFRSEAYQRPYQYLTRFYNNDNLDNFTYQGIEGTHAKCLQILLIYCGILDPSWAELRNFVWFLNLQLQDCENSVFCKFEFVGDTLRGFKNFVVEFMILMSKDFATPSLCITDQSLGRQQIDTSGLNERDLAPFLIRKRWESEPHPYIFFNDDHMSMTFIGFHLEPNDQNGVDAINPLTGNVIKRNIMTQELYTGLKLQRVPFNRDFDQLPRADKIEHLCSVLGIKWPTDPDETYELTTDNILKMMAIHMRFRCGIPVIIMGETGCGKTRLIKFMCELRRCGAPAENMKLVKVHGGTTSEMIYEKVAEAETLARTNKENHEFDSVLFFDEANTTEAISSIKEILCDNSVQGQQLGCQTGLQIIAACNPYRKHTEKMIERLEASGLGYRVRAEETEDRLGSIPLRQLVYRVHALPPSMIPLVWDFGQLNDSTEQMYIEQIVQRQARANLIENRYIPTITKVLSSSQKFMRERKDECSFVSLRDVERCMHVFVWFHKNHSMFAEELRTFLQRKKNKPSFSPASDRVIWSLLMATGVCYQSCLEDKRPYQRTISLLLSHEYDVQRVQEEIQLMHDLLLNGVPMGKTIARNDALKENFFMMVICVELRIPLFIVGKPGSSKSLSKTLVADAMQGPASHSELYKRLKQIHLVSFQCSPHSTPEGIINTFKQCSRFQESKNLDEYISVVVLDEIGLAEDSPKMPLKTLHPLLEEGCVDDEPLPYKRVGFIGISNWALDPAKMNRGIFVSRGDPNQKELIKSAKGICSSEEKVLEKIKHLFPPFAKAYMTVCKEGKGFFGLRDFYSLIKMVFSITKVFNKCPTADQITGAVLRNFSGKDDVDVMTIFSTELRDEFAHANISTIDLVEQSISPALQVEQSAIDLAKQNISPFCQEQESRYLLILTKNYAALQILQQIFFSHQIHPEIIFGSSFPKDQEYTQICRNINRVKVCMETGQTVVLLNLQNLYESLYDALNQYYVTLGGQKYVDLGLGTHRVKCRVHKNFRLIVIEEKEVVYEQFPIPLINRLEKHYLDINTVLRDEQKGIARQLQKWVDDFISLSSQHSTEKQYTPSDVFIGYHSDTCSSVVLQITENQSVETEAQTILKKAKDILLNCATPDSVVRLDKSRLPDEEVEQLMKEYIREEMHSSLGDYIVYHTQQEKQSNFFTEVTTFSRLLTATDTQQLQSMVKLDDIKLLSLYQFDTEYSFLKKIREFLGSAAADKVLIIQTDYDEDSHRGNILSSAKYSCINEINKWATTDNTKTFVYFVTKLPRMEGGTSYVGFQGGPWRSVHIDDLRRSKEFVSDVHSLKNLRISDLFEDPPEAMETEDLTSVTQNDYSTVLGDLFNTTDLVRSCVQSAVSMLRDAADSGELSTKRVENLLTLLDESETQGVFVNIVRKRLHSLLEEYEAKIHNPKNWVLREASNVNALQEGGTFLHTLWRKIQAVVTPLLANLVSVIDRDCNLDLLLDSGEDIRNLWLEIFASKEVLNVPYVRVENSTVLMVQSHIIGGSTMRCVMPFSWWIKDFLDGLMMQTSRHEKHLHGRFHELFLNTPLGSYMAKNVNEKMKKEFFERYLQDFVSMTMKVASNEELQLLRQALASCVDEVWRRKRDEDQLSLPHIHIAYHCYQSRLQNLSRMISLRPEIVSPLQRNPQIRHCPEMVLDVHAAMACVESLDCPTLDTDALCQQWLKEVKRLQASLELICSQQLQLRYKERLHDVRNGWRRIYILSLFVEHMLLGFQNEEKQLRTLVLNHFQTLSRVLAGNSDVKSNTAFKAVIEVLKSCKQGASDQIFRFGLQCGVCIREPQDPVGLPCHHIYCSTCIRASLDAGQTSCPICRQELPNDFQPHVSEDIRASIKKNAEFRQHCNGFFIDLLSTVCFKDNRPPAKGVITHLLSYLMVETEHEQIHTKDLSPFDESPDKNPVVRSVILKLLLKFSFEEVKEYLQQHLSSVEDSKFVDEGDKAELYALYINCLEDSMWEKMPQEGNKAEALRPCYDDETQFLHSFLAEVASVPATVSIQHLQHIAQLRLSLTMAAQLISDNLSENNVPDRAEDFVNMVIKLCEESGNDWFRVYLIRKLSEWHGVELVQTLVKQPKFSWLFPAEVHQQNEDGGQMDEYLVYGDEYKAVRDAVAKAVVDGDVEQIEEACEKCTAPPRNRTMFILLALFREVTTLYRSVNTGLHPTPERCQAFGDLIQGSRFLHQREVRDFASALVHNRLGALAIHPGHTIVDNTVIELTVHLAAVLLTGTQPLLRPLQQLGLSPENMQGAFIPTMPDDMLAVAQAVIQQNYGRLTWYVCPNNHPCFVDECGLPMQKGKCLECGHEIGGEHHAALPEFRPIQLQHDRTRPGHILGDPERRSDPDTLDTKNMSLTPFTLVRLVTHLAMLLGASEKAQFVQQIIQPPVEDVCSFLTLHIIKDLDQLSQALGRGADDTVTTVHLVLRSLLEPVQTDHTNPHLTTKASRNTWETTVAAEIMMPQVKDLDQFLQEAQGSIRTDSRVSSNFIMRTTFGDDCTFLTSLPQDSQVHSSAVWSCRERLSLLSLTHLVEYNDQKEELPLLWKFLQKEREFRQIKLLPDILILQKRLVRKFQNASDQIVGSIGEFIEKQTEMRSWFEKYIDIFLKTWNLLRVSVTSNEMKIPDEFCSEDLDLNSDLQYLLPRRQGPGLCATGLVSYLVALHNELVNTVDSHTGEDSSSSYRVSVAELTEQHVISYEVEKDLLPLVLSNCQYSLEHGHETISQYDLPRIQQQILTRFLQGKPLINRTGIPTLVNTQERDYETVFKAVKGKVPQEALSSLIRTGLSRELDSYSEVCEALKIVELLLGFLTMTGGDPKYPLVAYLQDMLKMADHIDRHILQALGRCTLRHCISLWQLLSSLKSENMLRLKREPFSGYPAEYQKPLTEEDKNQLKGFVSRGNVDQWLLEMHEFILLNLGRPQSIGFYQPFWSVKDTLVAYMDCKEEEVPAYLEDKFPENLLLSQIVETWKCSVIAKQDWMMNG